MSLDTKQLVNF